MASTVGPLAGAPTSSPRMHSASTLAGIIPASDRYSSSKGRFLTLSPWSWATAPGMRRQSRPVIRVSIAARASMVEASCWRLRTALCVSRCRERSRRTASWAASRPVASIPGHGSHVMSLAVARRTRFRLIKSGTGRAASTKARTNGQSRGHIWKCSSLDRVDMPGRVRRAIPAERTDSQVPQVGTRGLGRLCLAGDETVLASCALVLTRAAASVRPCPKLVSTFRPQ